MSTILFTKQGLEDAIYSGDSRAAYQSGLVSYGGSTSPVTITAATGISFSRPFVKSASIDTAYVPYPPKFMAGGPTGLTKLIVYSGERPEISTISDLASFDSQKLIQFSVAAYSATRGSTGMYVETGSATNYTGFKAVCGICPSMTSAIGSGVATWFWFGVCMTDAEAQVLKNTYTGNYNNVSTFPFVTGSVGLLGSGADLEIADKNIVSGQQYKSFGFNFYIPAINTIIG